MAQLTRPSQTKVFGSSALSAELSIFGQATLSTDINLILNSTQAERGWGTVGANDFPPLEWFNAYAYAMSYYTAYLFQQGVPSWTALQNYYVNSYAVGSNGKIYQSLSGTNGAPNVGNDPTTDTVNWKPAFMELTGATGSAILPRGTTAQRDASPQNGYMRYNNDTNEPEVYKAGSWGSVGGGQMLGTAQVKAISYNAQTINENITIPANYNYSMVGTVTIGTGYTVTGLTGSRGVVL